MKAFSAKKGIAASGRLCYNPLARSSPMKKFRQRLFPLLLVVLLTGCDSPQPARMLRTPFPVRDAAGNGREYRVFLPARLGDARRPLLAYFHGVISPGFRDIVSLKDYTGSPVEETGLIPFCRSRGIILVVPTALYEYTFLNCRAKGWLIEREVDGVEKIIDAVIAHYPVDRRRVFLAGLSAGAGISHHLANRRPQAYSAILSHSQAYVNAAGEAIPPLAVGPQFGVVYAYNDGDYPGLIRICVESERLYRERGYRTALLRDLPPHGHAWSATNNGRFWKLLNRLGRKR
jgi:pimeloyl-ACP methyl ester carboxylesterase